MKRAKQRRMTAADYRVRDALRLIKSSIKNHLARFEGFKITDELKAQMAGDVEHFLNSITQMGVIVAGSKVEDDVLYVDIIAPPSPQFITATMKAGAERNNW